MANPIFRLCGRHAEVEFGERFVSIVDFGNGGWSCVRLPEPGSGRCEGVAAEGVKGTTDNGQIRTFGRWPGEHRDAEAERQKSGWKLACGAPFRPE